MQSINKTYLYIGIGCLLIGSTILLILKVRSKNTEEEDSISDNKDLKSQLYGKLSELTKITNEYSKKSEELTELAKSAKDEKEAALSAQSTYLNRKKELDQVILTLKTGQQIVLKSNESTEDRERLQWEDLKQNPSVEAYQAFYDRISTPWLKGTVKTALKGLE